MRKYTNIHFIHSILPRYLWGTDDTIYDLEVSNTDWNKVFLTQEEYNNFIQSINYINKNVNKNIDKIKNVRPLVYEFNKNVKNKRYLEYHEIDFDVKSKYVFIDKDILNYGKHKFINIESDTSLWVNKNTIYFLKKSVNEAFKDRFENEIKSKKYVEENTYVKYTNLDLKTIKLINNLVESHKNGEIVFVDKDSFKIKDEILPTMTDEMFLLNIKSILPFYTLQGNSNIIYLRDYSKYNELLEHMRIINEFWYQYDFDSTLVKYLILHTFFEQPLSKSKSSASYSLFIDKVKEKFPKLILGPSGNLFNQWVLSQDSNPYYINEYYRLSKLILEALK